MQRQQGLVARRRPSRSRSRSRHGSPDSTLSTISSGVPTDDSFTSSDKSNYESGGSPSTTDRSSFIEAYRSGTDSDSSVQGRPSSSDSSAIVESPDRRFPIAWRSPQAPQPPPQQQMGRKRKISDKGNSKSKRSKKSYRVIPSLLSGRSRTGSRNKKILVKKGMMKKVNGQMQMVKDEDTKKELNQFLKNYNYDEKDFQPFVIVMDGMPFVSLSLVSADNKLLRKIHFDPNLPGPSEPYRSSRAPRRSDEQPCSSRSVKTARSCSRRSGSSNRCPSSRAQAETDQNYKKLWKERKSRSRSSSSEQ